MGGKLKRVDGHGKEAVLQDSKQGFLSVFDHREASFRSPSGGEVSHGRPSLSTGSCHSQCSTIGLR